MRELKDEFKRGVYKTARHYAFAHHKSLALYATGGAEDNYIYTNRRILARGCDTCRSEIKIAASRIRDHSGPSPAATGRLAWRAPTKPKSD
jgi:hypothetical protein